MKGLRDRSRQLGSLRKRLESDLLISEHDRPDSQCSYKLADFNVDCPFGRVAVLTTLYRSAVNHSFQVKKLKLDLTRIGNVARAVRCYPGPRTRRDQALLSHGTGRQRIRFTVSRELDQCYPFQQRSRNPISITVCANSVAEQRLTPPRICVEIVVGAALIFRRASPLQFSLRRSRASEAPRDSRTSRFLHIRRLTPYSRLADRRTRNEACGTRGQKVKSELV